MKKKCLVIIPAYNEADNISSVIKNLAKSKIDVDYVVVNDCSIDNTVEVLESEKANYLKLPVNLGIGGAVQAGYIYAKENNYDIAIQIDGDGQHDPEYLDRLIEPILEGEADCVIGSRFVTNEGFRSSALRRMGINWLSFIIKLLCGVTVKDVTSGFRAVNRELIELFSREYAQDYPEPEAIISCAIHNSIIKEVPVVMHERQGGVSSINSFKSIYYMIKVTISLILCRFSTRKGEK